MGPLRQAFGIPKPSGKEGVPKFPRIYPTRGSPFQPKSLLCTEYTIMPSDCDMYRVIFHPQMVSVCEKVNFAINANLAKPVGVGERFLVRVFIEPHVASGQTR